MKIKEDRSVVERPIARLDEQQVRFDEQPTRLDEQQAEIAADRAPLEARAGAGNASEPKTKGRSRRDLMKLAGASVIGAAATAMLGAEPAAAADGQAILLGTTGNAQNHMTSPTSVVVDSMSSDTPALRVDASTATGGHNIDAIEGFGDGLGVGVKGTGGAGISVAGISANGVVGIGGASNGTGVVGSGGGSNGTGVIGNGGASGGDGVFGFGTGARSGVVGFNLASGRGVYGFCPSGDGVHGEGQSGVTGIGIGPVSVGGYFAGTRAVFNLQPVGVAGPPAANYHFQGDIWVDSSGIVWACITAGTPGVFAPLQTGGANITHFVKVSNTQYHLANSDGKTWQDMDAANLVQLITPAFNAQAVISVSADLWTANAGFNQDIGIFISGGIYGSGTIVAWKESGGFAGTFSPNAAFVETTQPLVAGTAYTIKVRWKTNKPAGVATIYAGAGPLPPGSAGGGVTGQISPTRLATHLVVDVPSPSVLHIPANNPSATPPPFRASK